MTAPKLNIEVFNGFKITCKHDGQADSPPVKPGKRALFELLAYMATGGGNASRDDARTALYGKLDANMRESRLRHEMGALRTYFGELTRMTDENDRFFYLPQTTRMGFIDFSKYCVTDVGEFLVHLEEARGSKTRAQMREHLLAAKGLYEQGPLLQDYSDWTWVETRRTELKRRFERVCKQCDERMETLEELGTSTLQPRKPESLPEFYTYLSTRPHVARKNQGSYDLTIVTKDLRPAT